MLKKNWAFFLIFGGLFFVLIFINNNENPEIKWTKTFNKSDKSPFGCNALYRILENGDFSKKLFVKKTALMQNTELKKAQNTSYLFLTDRLFFDQYESKKLLSFARNGNKIFLCANHFDGIIADTFKIETISDLPLLNEKNSALDTSDNKQFSVGFIKGTKQKYSYDCLLRYASFSNFDSTRMSILAADDSGRAVMVGAKFGKGEIIFLSLPDVFSNYYIVNNPSRFFTYKTLNFLQNETLYWDEYYKTSNGTNQSPFRFLVSNNSLYYAFWLMILATLFFMFFGMKREQRAIPIITPHTNSTLEFVEIVASVYFSAKNHKIIAEEKILVFLEFIRVKFQLKTQNISEEELIRVSRLSGIDKKKINELFANIKYISSVESLNEQELVQFNLRIEDFYKNNKR